MNPNQFVSTTTRGFGSRIMSAIIGVPLGLLLIFGSCIMLYWNEGRTDYSKIAKTSVSVQASHVEQSQNGKFISVTGTLKGQNIDDGAYLRSGSYVAVQRTVEEYAWVEQTQTQSHNNTGGSQSNTTTYTYKEEWVDQPANSSDFKYPQGHQNPPKPLDDSLVRASSATVGAYSFDPQTIKLPSLQNVALSSADTDLPAAATTAVPSSPATPAPAAGGAPLSNLQLADSQYIYGGTGNLSSPRLGDIRVSYQALPSGTTATAFGQLNNGSLAAYTDPHNHTLYDLLMGDRQTAIATLHSQYERITWILRGVGLILIWVGLMMLLAPLDTLLDFIPFVGEIGGVLSMIITFPIALVLGGTIIIIGYTLHHLVALLIGVPLIFVVWVGIFKLIKKARNIPKRGGGGSTATPITPPNSSSGSSSIFPVNNSGVLQSQNYPPPAPQPSPVVQPTQYTSGSVPGNEQPSQPAGSQDQPPTTGRPGSLF